MSLVVQKFGGTSVGDAERLKRVAGRVAESHALGHQLVVVVSAMGGVTDSLVQLAKQMSPAPPSRELDMLLATGEQTTCALLAMALAELGVRATSLTGPQAGIVTDGVHTKARIVNITPTDIVRLLDAGEVVIVAGFQGQTADGTLTTLGRGGSDLTAVALSAVLKADVCQIFTDVDGIFTADPRRVPDAKQLAEIAYDELLELAGSGAKVMQLRSVELAKRFGVVFEVRSSITGLPGTTVGETTQMEEVLVRAVTLDVNQVKVTLVGLPDTPGTAARVFRALADRAISVDVIVQNDSHHGPTPTTDLSFTVEAADRDSALSALDGRGLGWTHITAEPIAKLTVVGVGMRSHAGVAATIFETLASLGVNIAMISTSEIRIAVVIAREKSEAALCAVHAALVA